MHSCLLIGSVFSNSPYGASQPTAIKNCKGVIEALLISKIGDSITMELVYKISAYSCKRILCSLLNIVVECSII